MSRVALAAIRDWHVYHCPRCNASNPPKDKYVVIVCKQGTSAWGFFINSEIPAFIRVRPSLLASQIRVTPEDYDFLDHQSFIGCNDLKTFFAWELKRRICPLIVPTKEAIIAAVAISETLDAEQKKVILANR